MAREDSENEEREIGGGITIPFEFVKRRMQEVLPETAAISNDAVKAVQTCVSARPPKTARFKTEA